MVERKEETEQQQDRQSMTHAFPVAYPLSSRQLSYAWQPFPLAGRARIDKKLVAAVYYLRARRFERVLWIEDGFSVETREWAKRSGNVRLIDTTDEAIKRMLLSCHVQAVQECMEFLKPNSVP